MRDWEPQSPVRRRSLEPNAANRTNDRTANAALQHRDQPERLLWAETNEFYQPSKYRSLVFSTCRVHLGLYPAAMK
jgi:hypothetical protein